MVDSRTDVCSYKKAWTLDNWFRKLIQNPYKIVGEYVEEGQTVLDLGCGPGFFSLAMAEMVGEKGRVISADIQEEMLQMLREKSDRMGLKSRIVFHKARPDKIGISELVNFALAFYMVHEVPDKKSFLSEIASHLKPDGRFLIVEPKFHVSKPDFDDTLKVAQSVGLEQISEPKILFSRAALLRPHGEAMPGMLKMSPETLDVVSRELLPREVYIQNANQNFQQALEALKK